jgi:hypothetical protein
MAGNRRKKSSSRTQGRRSRSRCRQEIPDTVYAYLAGVVDADGTITCIKGANSSSISPGLNVHQAEREAVDLFAATFGGEVKMRPAYSPLATRETFGWSTTAVNRVEVLTRLLPHLRQKRKQAEIALEICRLNASWRTTGRGRHRPDDVTKKLEREHRKLRRANDFGRRARDTRIPAPPREIDPDVPDIVAAYLAGVLDADGHLRARKQVFGKHTRYPVEVKLKQVTSDSIKVLQQHFGIKVRVDPPSIEGGRRLLIWSCAAHTAESLLRAVEPYMLIKKERAQVLLECIDLNKAPRQAFKIPEIVPGEPMLKLSEAAKLAGMTYGGAAAAAREGRIPTVRKPRGGRGTTSIFVPASFIEEWRNRDHRRRAPEHSARLDELVERSKVLNSRSQ